MNRMQCILNPSIITVKRMTKYTERIIWPLVGTQDGLSVLAADLRMRGGRMGAVGAVTPV